ncbi:U3 small nucleolar RNA-associated protein [Drechslerella dactyloides]|uniref:U3 small nucleolar RNA-associated protein n=1 Tax=Drechslerella dactyloides TaxID=74499 RepID=A0AAD6IXR6_DREDA|nr:U3 small nucleolar RNA-associated protein [Drechslerella dactyloides]
MSDKARFYLEQGLPELQELERKKIFTKEEIQSISRKRSHFEHRIAAARCKPGDFLSYATYEMNLDALRHKRMKRLNVRMKGSAYHLGARRIFFIFQRATRKFHGDVQLWKTYAEFCRAQKSHGLLRKVIAGMLRLHPTKADLWVYAAQIAVDENESMAEARGYLQRGLRFCRHARELWVEYAKFECLFIGRVAAAAASGTQVLGVEGAADPNGLSLEGIEDGDEEMEEDSSVTLEADEIMLPTVTEAELNGEQEATGPLQRQEERPNEKVLEGVILLIVFDEAVSANPGDPSLAISFFTLFEQFTTLACQRRILDHVDEHLTTTYPTNPAAQLCHVREPLVGVPVTTVTFPAALKVAFKRFGEARAKCTDKQSLYDGFVRILLDILAQEDSLDESLDKALRLFLGKLVRWSQDDQLELANKEQVAVCLAR